MHQSVAHFLDQLRNDFHVEMLGDTSSDWQTYTVDLSQFRILVSRRTPVIISKLTSQIDIDPWQILDTIVTLLSEMEISETISIIILPDKAEKIRQVIRGNPSYLDLRIIDLADIADIDQSLPFKEQFLKLLRNDMELTALSPYNTGRPATRSIFFGREQETHQIMSKEKTSFAVWGMRKMGKTSLLQEIRLRLLEDRKYPVERVIYTDCNPFLSPYDFLAAVTLPIVGANQAAQMDYREFDKTMRSLSRNGKWPITFLLDEVDALFDLDASKYNRSLIKAIRASHMNRYCRYIISGFRGARQQAMMLDSPLFNFTAHINLRELSIKDARLLVTQPMRDLGLTIDESVVTTIYDETRGQPTLIQSICEKLIKIATVERKGLIQDGDLAIALADPELFRITNNIFFDNTTPLEKLIVYSHISTVSFSIKDVDLKLRRNYGVYTEPVDLIRSSLEYLTYMGILSEATGKYRFLGHRFRDTLLSQDIKYLIDKAKEEGVAGNFFVLLKT